MSRLGRHYFEYRNIGFAPFTAFRLAWLVAMELVKPVPLKAVGRH